MPDRDEHQPLEKPEEIVDDIIQALDGIHSDLVDSATEVGRSLDVYRRSREIWAELGNASATDEDAARVYTSGVRFLSAVRDEIYAIDQEMKPLSERFEYVSGSAETFTGVTGTTASFLTVETPGEYFLRGHILLPESDRYRETQKRLAKLDKALAETYEEVWQARYGTRADPQRAGLFLVRQAFDHLFQVLAPDDQVRNSPFWEEKGGDDPNQVTRRERIQFAAYTRIKDKNRAKIMAVSAKHMLDVYNALNSAHERGELDESKTDRALSEMTSIIEEWAQALEL
jgi:hypothetical protein